MTDPIADMLTRVRNAIAANHPRVDVPGSKLKLEVARILKEEGYINNFTTKGEGVKYVIRIFLRYDAKGVSSITHLSRVSRPGRRVYVAASEIPESSWRLRDKYRFHFKGTDEWKEGPPRKFRRRDIGRSILVNG